MKNQNSLSNPSKIKEIIKTRYTKLFKSPYRKFNINWFQEKRYKHGNKNKKYKHIVKNGVAVHFSDPQAFLFSVKELFIDEIYKFSPDSATPKIIDCGANIGMSILFFKLNYPGAKIIAFEPDLHNYLITKQNIDSWKYSDIELEQKAVWIHNEQISFNQLSDMGSYIVPEDQQATGSDNNITRVDCVRLKNLLNTETDFLKLDIEGAEYDVIKDCRNSLSNVKNLFIEYHGNYNEMHKLTEILDIVTEQGFAYYIKEAGIIYGRPFFDKERKNYGYDVQLNIFCFRSYPQ